MGQLAQPAGESRANPRSPREAWSLQQLLELICSALRSWLQKTPQVAYQVAHSTAGEAQQQGLMMAGHVLSKTHPLQHVDRHSKPTDKRD